MIVIRLCFLVVRILFDDLYLQIVKGDIFYERTFSESCFGGSFEIADIVIEPYGNCKVKGCTGFFKRVHDLVGTCIVRAVLYDDIFYHMSFFEFSDPESEHLLYLQ